jgi:hypothetical protein
MNDHEKIIVSNFSGDVLLSNLSTATANRFSKVLRGDARSVGISSTGTVCTVLHNQTFFCAEESLEYHWDLLAKQVTALAMDGKIICVSKSIGPIRCIYTDLASGELIKVYPLTDVLSFSVSRSSMCVVDTKYDIYCKAIWFDNAMNWVQVNGKLTSITLGGTVLCGVGIKDFEVYCLSNWQIPTDWIMAGFKAKNVVLTAKGKICGINLSNNIICRKDHFSHMFFMLNPNLAIETRNVTGSMFQAFVKSLRGPISDLARYRHQFPSNYIKNVEVNANNPQDLVRSKERNQRRILLTS